MNSSSPVQSPAQCLECGADLGLAEVQGLCARCLLKFGLASQLNGPSVPGAGARLLVAPPIFPFEFGDYHVVRLLGRGGMGAVYEALHRPTGRRVALKVLGHTIDSPEMRKRFLREGQLAAAVNHPNSVYIFGTEEIENVPVIAMELVVGGTLKDALKQKGPLPVREAVDHILQVIAGLEAAQVHGILHRDIKPANCFIGPDGAAKIGDYGLSVSTLARNDTQLTASGVLLGTPSFAPPEQLRGDDLDVRADIYSIGATLYALLTGRPPIEGENAVQVVAAVLDRMPVPVSKLRPETPAGLSELVARCLAKNRAERFPNYAELRDALIPYSSETPEPAPPALRFVASIVDELLISIPWILGIFLTGEHVDERWLTERSWPSLLLLASYLIVQGTYYTVGEGRFGTTIGKSLCGLRVASSDHGLPGLGRAGVRSLLYVLGWHLGTLVQAVTTTPSEYRSALNEGAFVFTDISWLAVALLFVTIRRSNGFTALHDRISQTRVVVRRRSETRPRLATTAVSKSAVSNLERIGPFTITGLLSTEGWVAGYDHVLRRQVWIRRSPKGSPTLPDARRDLARNGRLRWIAGARTDSESWDAFEAAQGRPLLDLPAASQTWSSVRHWLLDLTEEIDAGTHDGTLPAEMSLANVWLTTDGRAIIADEPCTAAPERETFRVMDPKELQRFLHILVERALDRSSLTLSATDFLKRLAEGGFDRATFLAGNLKSLVTKPAEITFRRRLASFVLAPSLSIAFALVAAIAINVLVWRNDDFFRKNYPAHADLPIALQIYHTFEGGLTGDMILPDEITAMPADLKTYIVGHHADFIQGPDFPAAAEKLTKGHAEVARKIVKETPVPEASAIEVATRTVEPMIKETRRYTRIMMLSVAPAVFVALLCLQAFIHTGWVLLVGSVPGLRLFHLAVVDSQGNLARRPRLFARALLVWSPLLLSILALALTRYGPSALKIVGLGFVVTTLGLFAAGCVVTLIRKKGGWQDMLAGTRLTPM